ncbi:MAG TPA: hypothetical protein VFD01_08690 [Candidatus Dormibacteraeota bacterium]|jgi:hypothetical protein|nr:hypothetical protein [Candidatus Dormibacteraeota bacterium]
MSDDPLEVLLASRILARDASGELGLGDQDGLLAPAEVDRLGRLAGELIPPGIAGIVIGESRLDALLGYAVGRSRGLPILLLRDHEGIAELRGEVPEAGALYLLTGVLESSRMLDEFEGLCRRVGASGAGALALVSTLSPPDPRVRAVVQLPVDRP